MAYFRGGRGGSKRVNSQILGQKGGVLGGVGGQKRGFFGLFWVFSPIPAGIYTEKGVKKGGGGGVFRKKRGKKGGGGGG